MDLFTLVASLTLDSSKYESGIDDAERKAETFGSKVKRGLGAVAKFGGMALTAGAAATVALTKSAVEAYADYEQLVGGVETLFKDSADLVQEYAANAYKTAGLSANEYMETVTGFSASLLQSLGGDTEEAARISDMAITDMADNANKMGTAMESITVAYQGFAKQNYTMLDNLKLGYGGTKEEMERLLEDAEKFSGVHYDISNLNDVYEAIHVVQTELGITGTTAKEASETIAGSTAAAKSAWKNLITGIADDNADFGKLVDKFADSIATAAKNILPRIGVALQGVGKLVEGLAPVIAEAVPALVTDVLPGLLESAISIVTSVVDVLTKNLPALIPVAIDMILTLADAIIENIPQLIPAIVDVIFAIVDKLTEPETMASLIEAAIKIIGAVIEGILRSIPRVLEAVGTVLVNLFRPLGEAVGKALKTGGELISGFAKGIAGAVSRVVGAIANVVKGIWDGITGAIRSAATWGRDLIDNFIGGIKAKVGAVVDAVKGVAGKVRAFLGFSEPDEGPLSNFHTYAPDMMELFAKGIRDNEHLITDQIAKSFDFGSDIANIGLTGNEMANGGTTNTFGAVSISIYPQEGQSADDIAEAVMERIQAATNRRAAALT